MRITGGVLGGRLVEVPEGVIRPAMDRMRESVFAILGDLAGKSFLDLFSGSGIIALEAASRGASPVEAVEMDRLKHRTLLRNVAMSPVPIRCRFMAVELYVRRAGGTRGTRGTNGAFDYVFCDPPFDYRFKEELLAALAASALVGPDSCLMLHRPRRDSFFRAAPEALELRDRREYGRSLVEFFSLKGGGDGGQEFFSEH